MTPPRTVIVGSALPLLILIGLIGFPPARIALGLEGPQSPSPGSNTLPISGTREPISVSRVPAGMSSEATEADEALSLARLRRSISAGQELAFIGTEIVSAWHQNGSTTRVLVLSQGPDGVRTASAQDVGAGERRVTEPASGGDALAGLSDRALEALAASYDLRIGGTDRVAGRAATMVVAAKHGQEAARMWLDDRTGLLLRQDVFDAAGRLHRMAAFVSLTLTATSEPTATPNVTSAGSPLRAPTQGFGVGGVTLPAARRSIQEPRATPAPAPSGPWSDVVSPAELTTLRTAGWPCPAALAAGFVLLDARRTTTSGGSTLHLTYGDGLSAISVFLQRGQLDSAGLTGLTAQKWDDTEVYVREGWPDVMVWQGGPTVITAIGEAEPADLRSILSALPRQSNHGTLASWQHRMGSALAWFKI
ncbi:MAG TPA: sigma-E factor regulatory protein RseB domain-containing protein [Kineosporiaceae bacterium]|nr:sigma-E factor regulatory protein RseB domain-containing protein [Kineosporiaceae bacterium]